MSSPNSKAIMSPQDGKISSFYSEGWDSEESVKESCYSWMALPIPGSGRNSGNFICSSAPTTPRGNPSGGKFQPNEDRNVCFEVCYL